MIIDLLLLREWCERLCRLPSTDAHAVVTALGITGAALPRARHLTAIHPPPAGTSSCEVGVVRDRFSYLRLTFTTPALARPMLEDAMGPGLLLRPLGHDRGRRVAYRVVLPDAPYSCDLLATFAEPPNDGSLATGGTLRRERGVPRDPVRP